MGKHKTINQFELWNETLKRYQAKRLILAQVDETQLEEWLYDYYIQEQKYLQQKIATFNKKIGRYINAKTQNIEK